MNRTNTMSVLKNIIDTVTASSEDDVSGLLQMLSPTDDRYEMGEVYVDVMNYNPITYFDERYLENKLVKIIDNIPDQNIRRVLEDDKEAIIDQAMEYIDQDRDELLRSTLIRVLQEKIKDKTGQSYLFFNDEDTPEVAVDTDDEFEIEDDDDDDGIDDELIDDEEDDDDFTSSSDEDY